MQPERSRGVAAGELGAGQVHKGHHRFQLTAVLSTAQRAQCCGSNTNEGKHRHHHHHNQLHDENSYANPERKSTLDSVLSS